jgi:hypothetical protein
MSKESFVNFEWDVMEDKFKNGKLKDNLDCKEYVESFFLPTTAGTHVHFEDGKPTIIQDATMKTVYLKRFPKAITKWYNEVLKPRKLICDIHKPLTGKNFVNLSSHMMHRCDFNCSSNCWSGEWK